MSSASEVSGALKAAPFHLASTYSRRELTAGLGWPSGVGLQSVPESALSEFDGLSSELTGQPYPHGNYARFFVIKMAAGPNVWFAHEVTGGDDSAYHALYAADVSPADGLCIGKGEVSYIKMDRDPKDNYGDRPVVTWTENYPGAQLGQATRRLIAMNRICLTLFGRALVSGVDRETEAGDVWRRLCSAGLAYPGTECLTGSKFYAFRQPTRLVLALTQLVNQFSISQSRERVAPTQ